MLLIDCVEIFGSLVSFVGLYYGFLIIRLLLLALAGFLERTCEFIEGLLEYGVASLKYIC